MGIPARRRQGLCVHCPPSLCRLLLTRQHFENKKLDRISDNQLRYIGQVRSDLLGYVQQLTRPEQIFAVKWCYHNRTPLVESNQSKYLTVSYEQLVAEGRQELTKLLTALRIPLDQLPAVQRYLKVSSSTAGDWSAKHEQSLVLDRLENWRDKLEPEIRRNILNVVERFGIEGFDEQVVPTLPH